MISRINFLATKENIIIPIKNHPGIVLVSRFKKVIEL